MIKTFKDPVTRMKFIILFGGLAIFIVVSLGVTLKVTGNPEFCIKCHEMKPQYSTWKVSAHSKIACTKCHIEPGIENLFKAKANLINETYLHFSESYFLPIQTKEQISDTVCLRCHSMQREFNASGDLIIPHDKHMKKEVSCIECHSGVVHGRISHRLETIDGDFSRWNPIMAKPQVALENRVVNMTQCLNCHSLRKVELRCEDCHKEIHFPESHKSKSWTQFHSLEAKKDLASCDKCHSYTNSFNLEDILKAAEPLTKPASKVVGSTPRYLIDYARTNTLCFGCHSKKPASHERGWGLYHPIKAKMDSSGCLVCHDKSNKRILNPPLIIDQQKQKISKEQNIKKYNNLNPASTTCNQCHINKHQNFQRETHPIRLPTGTKLNNSCFDCHDSGFCGNCHFSVK